ncbi:hypothetical protein MRX96_057400 [Rhipicephalus microplus]
MAAVTAILRKFLTCVGPSRSAKRSGDSTVAPPNDSSYFRAEIHRQKNRVKFRVASAGSRVYRGHEVCAAFVLPQGSHVSNTIRSLACRCGLPSASAIAPRRLGRRRPEATLAAPRSSWRKKNRGGASWLGETLAGRALFPTGPWETCFASERARRRGG